MTQPSPQQQMQAIREAYPTPEVVTERLHRALDELDAAIRAAAASPHWETVMPGREWTPAQEAEHAVLVSEGSGKLVKLLLSDKEVRQPEPYHGVYKDGKRVAPPGTEPQGGQSAESLLERNAATRALLTTPGTADPARTFHHPYMGQLDALDWQRMTLYHTNMHRRSMLRGVEELGQQG